MKQNVALKVLANAFGLALCTYSVATTDQVSLAAAAEKFAEEAINQLPNETDEDVLTTRAIGVFSNHLNIQQEVNNYQY